MFVNAESAFRTWLNASKVQLNHLGAFFKMPEEHISYPILVVTRIGGAYQSGEAPMNDARLSISVWGINKKQASDLTTDLVTKLFATKNEALDDSVYCYGITVDNVVWLPDNTANVARYVVDFTATLRAI